MHLKELDANLIVVLDALLIDASVTRAAERLGRSPSAVSHALSNLREIFGDALFVRAGQKLVPTPKARELAPTIHVVVSGMESLLRPIAPFDPSKVSRSFHMACRDSHELTLVRRLQNRLRQTAPGLRVQCGAPAQGQALEGLRSGQIQFLITDDLHTDDSRDILWQELYEGATVTLAHKDNPLTRNAPDMAGFAAASHIVTTTPDGFVQTLHDHFTAQGHPLTVSHVTSSTLAAVITALEGDGLVSMAAPLAALLCKSAPLAPVAIPVPGIRIKVRLGWHRSHDRDECHGWLRGELAALAQEMAQDMADGDRVRPASSRK